MSGTMINWTGSSGNGTPKMSSQIEVTATSTQTLLKDLEQRMQNGDGFSIATLNLDHVVKIRQNPHFRDAYARHSHVTADGNPIVWLSRLASHSVDLIPGSELIRPVLNLAAAQDVPVALFGSTEDTLRLAADRLNTEIENLKIVACLSPPTEFDPDSPIADTYIDKLAKTKARVIILALGAPKQEVFAIRAADVLPHVGFVSIGAGLDFIADRQIRAPKIVRTLAMEWLWRLLSNPVRFAGRYARCIAILPSLIKAALKARAIGKRHD